MQLMIDIDQGIAEEIVLHKYIPKDYENMVIDAIKNGTPLPKGHGRLMVLSEAKVKENQINLDFSLQKWVSEVDLSDATVAIIEADRGGGKRMKIEENKNQIIHDVFNKINTRCI